MSEKDNNSVKKLNDPIHKFSNIEGKSLSNTILKSIQESIIATDSKFIITYWNKVSEQIYGLKASEVIGKNLNDVIQIIEIVPGQNKKRFKELATNGMYQEEQLQKTKHKEVWVFTSVHKILEKGKHIGWVGLNVDISKQKKSEEVTKDSEEKYKTFFKKGSDGIFIIDINGKIIDVNESFAKMHGYTVEELMNRDLKKLDTPEATKKFRERMSKVLSGETINFDVEHYRKDGHIFPLQVSCSLIELRGKKFIIAFHRDVTEQKKAEKALKESESFHKFITEGAEVAIWDWDLITDVTQWSKNLNSLFGYPIIKVTNSKKWWASKIHPDDAERVGKTITDTITRKKIVPWKESYYFKKSDGSWSYVIDWGKLILDKKGNSVRMVGAMMDISKQKKSEEALKESESKFRDIFNSSLDGFILVSDKMKITDVNESASKTLKSNEKSIIDRNILELHKKEDHARCIKNISLALSGKPTECDCPYLDSEGKLILADSLLSSIMVKGRKYVLISFRETTKRKEAEQELKKRVDELEKINKITVGRELKMIELKKKIKELESKK